MKRNRSNSREDREQDLQTLQKLQKKNLLEEEEESDDENARRTRIHNYTNADSVVKEERFYPYYCSLCGTNAVVINAALHELPRRTTDGAAVVLRHRHFHKKYLQEQRLYVVKREGGAWYEKQFRWQCKQCKSALGYQPYYFEEGDLVVKPEEQRGPEDGRGKHFYLL